jgi:glycosyltransferase involved in cell wall biosynthesis
MKYTKDKKYDVVIGMVTYNHGQFIGQAIESVLMQKTNFSFALIICDDCSTDNTQDICINYQKQYPEKILYYRNSKNLGFTENGILLYERCYSKSKNYISLLEGDDFWLIDNKLQMQFDLMEKSEFSDCVICSTNYIEYFDDQKKFNDNWAYFTSKYPPVKKQGELIRIDESLGWKTKTATNFFRKKGLNLRKLKKYNLMVDTILVYELKKRGRVVFINECTAAYRIQIGGNWSTKNEQEKAIVSKRISDEIKRVNHFEEVFLIKINKRWKSLQSIITSRLTNISFF